MSDSDSFLNTKDLTLLWSRLQAYAYWDWLEFNEVRILPGPIILCNSWTGLCFIIVNFLLCRNKFVIGLHRPPWTYCTYFIELSNLICICLIGYCKLKWIMEDVKRLGQNLSKLWLSYGVNFLLSQQLFRVPFSLETSRMDVQGYFFSALQQMAGRQHCCTQTSFRMNQR